MPFQRYRSFIPEWRAFCQALDRPEPRTFRVRTGRIAPEMLRHRLEEQGFRLTPSSHVSDVFRVDREPFPLSETLEHWLGLLYIQQEATALAPPLLAPRPGEGVLDLCAAPGGKAAHLAELMDDRGIVVAVDSSGPRLRALGGNLSRLALTSVVAVKARGERIPTGARFHRVLVDVPCSGEGRARRGRTPRAASPGDLKRLPRLQEALLRRAVEVTVPGGRILYVTCTLAPEENEAVVDRVLADAPVALVPLSPGFPHAPGVTGFRDLRFRPELAGACRVHPHHLDSGGLFLALLEREGSPGPGPGTETRVPGTETRVPGTARAPAASPLAASALPGWTDLDPTPPEALAGWAGTIPALRDRGWVAWGDGVRMLGLPTWPLDGWLREVPTLSVIHPGLRAVVTGKRRRGRPGTAKGGKPPVSEDPVATGRPSLDLLRWIGPEGPEIGGAALSLSRGEWVQLLEGRELRTGGHAADGFASLALEGQVLGRGRLRGGRVLAELSPSRARWLHRVLSRQAP
jgi:16S rRNA C967 or C1407 C5-methylase (RsmB/RsmF family)